MNSFEIIKKLLAHDKMDIKEKDWAKIQLNYYKNPIPEYFAGDAMMMKDSGEKYTQNDYREVEKNVQKQIKILNNPIELSEKVEYK